MGNFLHKVSAVTDPIGNALTKGKNDLAYDVLTPKQGTALTGTYKGPVPGSQLYSPPPGGPPQDPRGPQGGPSMANAPTVTPGYSPNFFNRGGAPSGPGGIAPSVPGGMPMQGGPMPPSGGPVNAFRGGTPPIPGVGTSGAPPGMANTQPANPNQMAQQQMLIQMLRNRGMPQQ